MAERRMFAKTIIDSDAFLELPITAQLLYFHLSMRADDDGFVNNPRAIMNMIGAKNADMKLLNERKFIIYFESGVVVIKHWRIHNYIQKDRYQETKYKFEKAQLFLDENKSYSLNQGNEKTALEDDLEPCIQNGYEVDTQVRLGKDSIGKDSIDLLTSRHISDSDICTDTAPTLPEVLAYMEMKGGQADSIKKFYETYSAKSWYFGKKPWKELADDWLANDKKYKPQRDPNYGKAADFKPQSDAELQEALSRI